MSFETEHDRVAQKEACEVLAFLYEQLDVGPGTTLCDYASDSLYELMAAVECGKRYKPKLGGHFFLIRGRNEWSRRQLAYLGDLMEVLHDLPSHRVSVVEAIEIMLPHLNREELDLRYIGDHNGWRLESGPEFDLRFGRHVKLRLDYGPFVNHSK